MLFAIHAYEGIYQGLHGMEEYAVVDVDTEEQAEDIASEMSYEVMDSYYCIISAFEESASIYFEEGSREWNDFIEQARDENVAYDILEITGDTQGKSTSDLEEEYYNNPTEFLKTYWEEL